MTDDEPEPWWTQQDADAAWIARQEAISAALRQGRGWLAATAGKHFPLQVCRSRAGYYIGTLNEDGAPYSRESQEYWPKAEAAQLALTLGLWTQKLFP